MRNMRNIMNILGATMRIIGMILTIPSFLLSLPGILFIFLGGVLEEESQNDWLANRMEKELKK
jgi:hypothetical protein